MRSFVLLLVLVCAMPGAAFGQKNLAILNAFPGDKGPGTKALPDNVGGVSENHVVDFTSANFVVHDKAQKRFQEPKTAIPVGLARPTKPVCGYDGKELRAGRP